MGTQTTCLLDSFPCYVAALLEALGIYQNYDHAGFFLHLPSIRACICSWGPMSCHTLAPSCIPQSFTFTPSCTAHTSVLYSMRDFQICGTLRHVDCARKERNMPTRVCMCVCIYTYACVYVYIYIYIYIYMYIYTYSHTHKNSHASVCAYIYMYIYIYIYMKSLSMMCTLSSFMRLSTWEKSALRMHVVLLFLSLSLLK